MKVYIKQKQFLFIGYFLFLLLLQSCFIFSSVVVENDVVYSSKRIKTEFDYLYSQEKESPLIKLNQKIIKEISNSDSNYTAYDLIELKNNSFKLDNKVFIIVDNEPFSVSVVNYDAEFVSSFLEERKDIMTADSTEVSVITGYNKNQSREYRISYGIDNEIIQKIKTAQTVMLRYYAGPDMITIKIKGYNLKKMKKLIDTK